MSQTKRVTVELSMPRYNRLRSLAETFDLSMVEVVDLLMETVTPETLRPVAEKYRKRKEVEEQQRKEIERRFNSLTPEQQMALLAQVPRSPGS